MKYKPGQLIFQDEPRSESDGESSASFVYSSCPFIKKRKPSRSVAFSESVTEYYEIPVSSSDGSNEDEDVYEEPCRNFWPRNKHFFPRQVWQGLRRYARCEHTWDASIKQIKPDIGLKCQSWISHWGDKQLFDTTSLEYTHTNLTTSQQPFYRIHVKDVRNNFLCYK